MAGDAPTRDGRKVFGGFFLRFPRKRSANAVPNTPYMCGYEFVFKVVNYYHDLQLLGFDVCNFLFLRLIDVHNGSGHLTDTWTVHGPTCQLNGPCNNC